MRRKPAARQPRRQALTPELRRFLNTPRAKPEAGAQESAKVDPPIPPSEPAGLPARKTPPRAEPHPPQENFADSAAAGPRAGAKRKHAPAPVAQVEKASRAIELQQAVLILGALLLLALAFYGGLKFNYVRYLFASRNKPSLEENGPDRFPGIAAEDLVKQALVAEKADHWQDAVERFMAAKRKDLRYRGILMRVGSILYQHNDYAAADKAFERAIIFGENVETADLYRGMIALHRNDFAAGERYCQAAVAAAPFVEECQYYCAEAFRLDLKPTAAIPYYEKAALLARSDRDAIVCRFKIRLARLEAAETPAVSDELARKAAEGPLPVDWLLTSAAIEVRNGQVGAARQAIIQARDAKAPGIFDACVSDLYFKDVAGRFPGLADVLRPSVDLQAPFPK